MNELRPPLTASHRCAFLSLRAAMPQSGLPPSLEICLNLRRKNIPQIEVYFDMALMAEWGVRTNCHERGAYLPCGQEIIGSIFGSMTGSWPI